MSPAHRLRPLARLLVELARHRRQPPPDSGHAAQAGDSRRRPPADAQGKPYESSIANVKT
jgi:hypothetical protein